MARAKVQYQKRLSEAEFDRQYGTEEQMARNQLRSESLVAAKMVPTVSDVWRRHAAARGSRDHAMPLAQCGKTKPSSHRHPATAARQYHLSSPELGRRLSVTQTTACTVKDKLKQLMMERDAKKRLIGRVEMDDAYLGGERSGGKRERGAAGNQIVASVETTTGSRPARLKLRRVSGRRTEIEAFAKRSLDCRLHGCQRMVCRASSGSTPRSAISRRRSSVPSGRSATSTLSGRVRVPFTAATTWPHAPCFS